MMYITLFCSGSGSNAEKIMEYFREHPSIRVGLLLANKPDAYALERAKKFGIPTEVVTKAEFTDESYCCSLLERYQTDWIILAGFLWLIPSYLVKHFPDKIINIHPALLPAYGGKGMYGMHVHRAVVAAGEKKSGMTIHLVNEHYDEGAILFQASCDLDPEDSAEEVAHKVLTLEHRHFAPVIETTILNNA
ncbi:MAG: phosphoribosylglycinamide formyltransferase [Cytophagaceae bacterium]|jgi:phosphoribosylglycinamide formyltransferase-1|nr:phosphoribosylglycinamide formyltransferase [Cytophagaceae bacterium]